MLVCELIGCATWQDNECQNFAGAPQCPDRKAVADELVEALEDIAKQQDCGVDCGSYACSCSENQSDTALAALAKLKGDKPKEKGNLHHCSGAGMSKERLEELRNDEEDVIRTEIEREEE